MRPPLRSIAAGKPRRVDGDVRACGDHRVAVGGRRRGRGRIRHRRGARRGRARLRGIGLACVRLCCAGLNLSLFLLLERRLLLLPLHLRVADEILPADDDDERQHDGKDGVLILAHYLLLCSSLWGPDLGAGRRGGHRAAFRANRLYVGGRPRRYQLPRGLPLARFLACFLARSAGRHELGVTPHRIAGSCRRNRLPSAARRPIST